jgi:hypothetical protein
MLLLLFLALASIVTRKNYVLNTMSDHEDIIEEATSLFVARSTESIVGEIAGEWGCNWEACKGTLYAGSKGIYFLGSFFLFERKVVVYWEEIRHVQKHDQGIEVICKDEAVHYFQGIHCPDRVWSLLVSLHNDALLDRRGKRGTPRAVGSARRRNSDPWYASCSIDVLFNEGELEGDSSSTPKAQTTAASLVSKPTTAPVAPSKEISSMEEILVITGRLLLQPIPCSHEKTTIRGKLYVGVDALYFSGSGFFFWEKKLAIILWDQVLRIQIVNSPSKESDTKCTGLRFVGNDNEQFEFSSMDNVYKVWTSLLAVHNEKLTKSPRPRLYRRNNSDPLQASQLMFDFDDDKEPRRSLLSSLSTRISPEEATQNVAAEWFKVQQCGQFDHVIVQNHVLKCSLDRFFELFLGDDADHSIARFLEGRGDTSLQTARWEVKDGVNSRVVNYTHPVNVPLAPPEAAARKEQTYRRYGDYGLVLETKTYVKDLPLTDCFYVTDRIVVEARNGKKEEVSVVIEFGLTFVKSTMFRSIISKTTEGEFVSFILAFADYMYRALGEAVPEETVKAIPVEERPAQVRNRYLENPAILVLLLVVILFQAWIMVELRGIKASVQPLQVVSKEVANGVKECNASSLF